jgi:hypothetical protein
MPFNFAFFCITSSSSTCSSLIANVGITISTSYLISNVGITVSTSYLISNAKRTTSTSSFPLHFYLLDL